MDADELLRRLRATFVDELGDGLAALEQALLALERGGTAGEVVPAIDAILRTCHALKGAARAVSLGAVERTFHRLEGLLAAARARGAVSPEELQLLLRSLDVLRAVRERLREGRADAEAAAELWQAQLGGAPAPAGPPPGAFTPPPAAGDRAPPTQASFEEPPAAPSGELTMRVPAAKVDGLLARSGALLELRNRLESRRAEIEHVRDLVAGAYPYAREARLQARALGAHPAAGVLRDGEQRLARLRADLDRLSASFAEDTRRMRHTAQPLAEDVRQMRMVPLAAACEGLERLVRDLARATGKQVSLEVAVGPVELDRAVAEALRAPLVQLAGNAVDHGIEAPSEREAQGKSRAGRVRVAATVRDSEVEVRVSDDGRGLDLGAIVARARALGIQAGDDPAEIRRLVFRSGLSTAAQVTPVSGRGVGLDLVSRALEAVRGRIDVASTWGRGTTFTLYIPLTLGAFRALFVAASGQVFALPLSNVERLLRARPADLTSLAGRPALLVDGHPVSVHVLADLLGLPAPAGDASRFRPAVLVGAVERRAVLLVDGLLQEREAVAHGLGRRVRHLRLYSGVTSASELGGVPILDAAGLLTSDLPVRAWPVPAAPRPRRRILLVDDSMTTRALEESILAAAGYDVITASDGIEAWEHLQREVVDAVVTDIQMPRLDGIDLVRRLRAAPRTAHLPVVLVTALADEADRRRGMEAGANVYLVKSAFEQATLLEALKRII